MMGLDYFILRCENSRFLTRIEFSSPIPKGQRISSRPPHVRIGVSERDTERFDGSSVADPSQRLDGIPTHVPIGVLEHGTERFDGSGVADPSQRSGGSHTHIIRLLIPQCLY